MQGRKVDMCVQFPPLSSPSADMESTQVASTRELQSVEDQPLPTAPTAPQETQEEPQEDELSPNTHSSSSITQVTALLPSVSPDRAKQALESKCWNVEAALGHLLDDPGNSSTQEVNANDPPDKRGEEPPICRAPSPKGKGKQEEKEENPRHTALAHVTSLLPYVSTERARRFLDANAWDVETTVAQLLDEGDSGTSDTKLAHQIEEQDALQEKERKAQRLREEEESQRALMALLEREFEEKRRVREENERKAQEGISKFLEEERRAREEKAQQAEEATIAFLKEEKEQRDRELQLRTYPCCICFTEKIIGEIYIIDECEHRFCTECLEEYLKAEIQEGHGDRLQCPQPACRKPIGYYEVKQILKPEDFERYEKFLLSRHLEGDPSVRWCPRPNCGNAMIGNASRPMIICTNDKCRYTFCFNCKEEWHADATCEEYQRWKIENNEADARYQNWAQKNAKACPKCKSMIEKNGGCNHMTCRCGYEFCWLCMGKYSSGHFNRCQLFT